MKFQIVQDVKKPVKVLIYGKPGSGKTYTSLLFGKIINQITNKPIAVVDTENGRSSVKRRYKEFNYDWHTVYLSNPTSEDYIDAILSAQDQGYGAIILDSISPEWDSVIDRQAAMKGNSFTAWGAAKKPHKKFINTIINAAIPVICTCRAKVQYEVVDGKPKALGMAPSQNSDIIYEFDVAISLEADGVISSIDKQEMDILSASVGMRLAEEDIIKVLDWYGYQSTTYQSTAQKVSFSGESSSIKDKYIQRILELAKALNEDINPFELESKSIEELTKLGKALRSKLDNLNASNESEEEEYENEEDEVAEYDDEDNEDYEDDEDDDEEYEDDEDDYEDDEYNEDDEELDE